MNLMDMKDSLGEKNFNDFVSAMFTALGDTDAIIRNKKEERETNEAKRILEILDDDFAKRILLSSLKKRITFEELLDTTGLDPHNLDICLDEMRHLGLIEKVFFRSGECPYFPRYKITDFAKVILRDERLLDAKVD